MKTVQVIGFYPHEKWMASALCRFADPSLFYPDKGVKATAAKAICAECAHSDKCLQYALRYGIRDGVWGGVSEQDRRKMTRARRTLKREITPEQAEGFKGFLSDLRAP